MFTSRCTHTLLLFTAALCIALPVVAQHHTADTSANQAIELGELLRVIQFFNSGGFHCHAATEDGYAPGLDIGQEACPTHDSDYAPQDWQISLTELQRLIQFFNAGGYYTHCGTEDDFAPGTGPLFTCDAEGNTETILLPGNVPLEMVWIPAGTFMMGRYPGEQDSDSDEDPQHAVTVPGFWMGKYEVTQAQWLAVRGSWPGSNPSSIYGLGDSYPAYYISWNDAKDFITSLNAHIVSSGQGPLTVRLPSEAEWEYACRAGTQTRFYWGDDSGYTQIGNYAWYGGNNSPYGSKTVGGKLANAFGLYDMSGNVWEWCEDDWHNSYTGAPADGSAWIESPRASDRVLRGGGWEYYAGFCRSAGRDGSGAPGIRNGNIGFRLAAVQ